MFKLSECGFFLCSHDSYRLNAVPPQSLAAAPYMVLLCWCETKRIAFVKVYSLQFSLISPGIRGVKLYAPEDSTFIFFTRPRLLGKQALHMSPAMTVFAVKDFDLYFHPSTATPPFTPPATHTHIHTRMQNPYHPSPIPAHSLSN